jgi:hypothetical protein
MQMRARVISVAGALALTLSVALGGSAYGAPRGASETAATTASKTTGAQHFEVYSTSFEASYAPVYFTGVINTVGTGYKDFAEAQDQVYMPEVGGTLVIYHPGLTQTEGNTTTFDPVTCITHIFGSGPAHFIQGTGKLKKIKGTGVVNLDIRVFQRHKADGSCDNNLPPTGYIEIAKGDLTVTLN